MESVQERKPWIGAMVHYVDVDTAGRRACRAAMITETDGAATPRVSLKVFYLESLDDRYGVLFDDSKTAGTCHWMDQD